MLDGGPQYKKRRLDVSSADLSSTYRNHGGLVQASVGAKTGANAAGKVNGDAGHERRSYQQDGDRKRRKPNNIGGKRGSRPGGANESNATYSGELYGTNIFKLQLDELLTKEKSRLLRYPSAIRDALQSFKQVIESIPETEPVPVAEAEERLWSQHKVAIPFPKPRPQKDSNYKLQVLAPAHINVIGSYANGINSGQGSVIDIDLLVTMPPALFQEKDYLDHRYFYRRAYYIARIAAALRESSVNCGLAYEYLNDNELHPTLVVTLNLTPERVASRPVRIHIMVGVEESLFQKERLFPSRNCVRHVASINGKDPEQESKPTPLYNGSVLSDMLATTYLKLFNDASRVSDSFKDACILGRTWLRQRRLGSKLSHGGFGNFEWCCLLALLLEGTQSSRSVLSPGYSSYQLFKGTLQFLASRDLVVSPYVTVPSSDPKSKDEDVPCFLDVQRGHNILYKMTRWSYSALRQNAQNTVASLASADFDEFESTFLTGVGQMALNFDATIVIPIEVLISKSPDFTAGASIYRKCRELDRILRKALTDRIKHVAFDIPSSSDWDTKTASPNLDKKGIVRVNFVVNPANVSRAMDRGPSLDYKKDVKAFLGFWGHEKAVRMKFGNESPIETVKWETGGFGPSILEQIVSHVIRRHMSPNVADAARFYVDSFLSCLQTRERPLTQATTSLAAATSAFTRLERDLRSLEGLPLQIRQVSAAHSLLRGTELPTSGQSHAGSEADVVLQFEASDRWPDDLVAIQRTKIAFLLKLGDLLSATVSSVDARVGLEDKADPRSNQCFLAINYSGTKITFRLRIFHDREITLLQRQVNDKFQTGQENEAAAKALASAKRDYLQRSKHAQAVRNLCIRHPSLSPAIRLVKAWFAAHFLLDQYHISHELVELIVIRCFTRPWPWAVPCSASTAFARTIAWLAQWDWKAEPLIVDFDTAESQNDFEKLAGQASDAQKATVSSVQTRFEAWRHIDPALNRVVIFAASTLDAEGNTWTDHARPSKVVAARMTSLARAARQIMESEGLDVQPERLFTTELADFDFVIHLSTQTGSKTGAANGSLIYKNLEMQGIDQEPAVTAGLDSARLLLNDLRQLFPDALVFFFDEAKAESICCLWNPSLNERRWKPKLHLSTRPNGSTNGSAMAGNGGVVAMNKRAILNDIARLGGDLIRQIIVYKALSS